METPRGAIRIGCSGWNYAHWRGDFYPRTLPEGRWLETYAASFDTVEINNSFYRLPSEAAVRTWARKTPPAFRFAWKASRFLTHMKKLKDPDEPLARMMAPARQLRTKLGPILYQLPPRWNLDLERVKTFVRALPKRRRHVIEMRDASFYHPDVIALLRSRGVALCLHDMPGSESPAELTAPFAYVRFHGAGEKYGGGYDRGILAHWGGWIRARAGEGTDVYAYFNNDRGGHAPRDAIRLRELISL